jgi:uncharacterized protein with GYD domain
MSLYIALSNWTDQGIKNIKDSPRRLENAREVAKKNGCELKDFFMVMGAYDMVWMLEAPNDAAAAKVSLAISTLGNVRTTTLKAFPEDEYRSVIASV